MDTYRLTGLPVSYGKDHVQSLFPECDQQLIVRPISLAKSPYTNRSAEQVATVSFSKTPSFARTPDSNECPSGSSVAKPPRAEPLDCPLAALSSFLPLDEQPRSIRIDNNFDGLTPLADSQNIERAVDIVAATGLAGRAFGSWQHRDGEMWLRDHLPGDVKHARILLWGQTSKLTDSRSHLSTSDLRDTFLENLLSLQQTTGDQIRPLILIGHSLGGIIIKAAFVKASQDATYSHLRAAIHGLVFFGTPHEGMETAHWEAVWGCSPPKTLIRDLQPGSTLLKNLREGFPSTRMDIDILSCYERDETATVRKSGEVVRRDGPPVLYVSESSSCTFHPREERIPLNHDHSKIAKLAAGEGSPYYTIVKHLARMVRNARIVVDYRIRSTQLIEAMNTVAKSMSRYINELQNTDVLMLALKTEIEDISRTIIATETAFSDPPMRPFEAKDSATATLSKACEIFSDVERLAMNIPMLADVAHGQPVPHSPHGPTKAGAGSQEFSRAMIPLLLSVKEVLDRHDQTRRPGFLETFIGSDAAKQLGLDYVARNRSELEASDTELLEESKGFIEESEESYKVSGDILIGRYRPAPCADTKEVILEYRGYARELSQQASREENLHKLEVRTQHLATRLKNAIPGAKGSTAKYDALRSTMSVLHCIAWKHDNTKQRFVLIYELPRELQYCLREEQDLFHTLQHWSNVPVQPYLPKALSSLSSLLPGQPNVPAQPLDQLYFTAYQITRTVFNLHISGWLHKNINPSNILFVKSKENTQSVEIEGRPRHYPAPILKGFEFSRTIDATSERLPAEDFENNVYRHPNRQGLPSDIATFTQLHDLYAVGAVLFELGRCKRIKDVVKKGAKPFEIQAILVKESKEKIPKYLGTAFTRCVLRCLKGDFDGCEEKDGTVLAFAFRRLVVDELKRIAFACGAFVD